MINREQRVRMLAYRIWESEGRPDGQEERHWEMAERIVEAENAREEEQEWQTTHDETPILEDEGPLEDDEKGIDEQRLPLDDPEVEALKEEDTGVEVHSQPAPAKPRQSKASPEATRKAAPRKSATPKGPTAGSEPATEKKPTTKPRKPRASGPKRG